MQLNHTLINRRGAMHTARQGRNRRQEGLTAGYSKKGSSTPPNTRNDANETEFRSGSGFTHVRVLEGV